MRRNRENNKFEEKKSIRNSIQELFCEKSNIEICDNTKAIIEGSRGVMEYSESVIRVSFGSYSVAFAGRRMNLKCLSPTSLIIEGFFLNIEFYV